MHLYKNGMVCYADKDQIEHMLADGWSKTKPEDEVNGKSAESKESTEEVEGSDMVVDVEEVGEGDEVVGDEVDTETNKPTGRIKIVRKTTKK